MSQSDYISGHHQLPPGTVFRVLDDGSIAAFSPNQVPLPLPYATATAAAPQQQQQPYAYPSSYYPPQQQQPQQSAPSAAVAPANVYDHVNKPSHGQQSSYGGYGTTPGTYDEERGTPTYSAERSMAIPERLDFVRKTYSILTIQLAITCGIILVFVMVDEVRNYVQMNPGLLYSAIIISLMLVCALACFRGLAESFPINIVLLGFFTLCQSYLLGTISSFFNTTIVLQAIAITCCITGVLTLYAWTTKSDITKWGTFLMVGIMVLMFGFIIRMFLPYSPLMETIWACFGALLFAAYLVYDTFLIIHIIPPNAYVTACLMLYLDIVNMFLFILNIMGGIGRR